MSETHFLSEKEQQLVRSEAPECEQTGTWTDALLGLAREKKLFHLAVPEQLGGRQLSVAELMNVFESASHIDGSFGWTITLGAGAGVFAAFMEPAFAKEVFNDPGAYITGSGYPAGTAVRKGDAYEVNGSWKYATGTPHATLFTASCMIQNGSGNTGEPEIRAMAFYPDEVRSLDTWHSYGLKATASHDFEVKNCRIPEERSFTMAPHPAFADAPLYRFPFEPFASATLVSSMLGIARGFMDEVNGQNSNSLAKSRITAEEKLLHQKEQLHEAVQTIWRACENSDEIRESDSELVNTSAKKLAELCRSLCLELYTQCGMQALPEMARINRAWRDLLTAGQHGMLRNDE